MLTGDVETDAYVLLTLTDVQRGAYYAAAMDWPDPDYKWRVFNLFDRLRVELCVSHFAYSSSG